MISHVVFDFDGTLVDSLDVVVELYNGLADERGYTKITKHNLAELRTLSILERCRRLGVPARRLPGLIVEVGRLLRHATERVRVHDGVPELLQTLHERGLTLAVASTNREENIRAILARHGLDTLMTSISCSSRLFGKAHLLRGILRRAHAEPTQVVYVGDEHRDIEASRAVGIRFIGVTWGADDPERLREAAPDALVSTPAEIAELVQRWSSV